jgi:hypothetical protein
LVAIIDSSEVLVPVGVVTVGMLVTVLTVLATVAVVDVIGVRAAANVLEVVGSTALVVEATWLLVSVSKLVLAAMTLLVMCEVSVAAVETTLEVAGASTVNPEMGRLAPLRVDSVFDSDEDSTLVVAAT